MEDPLLKGAGASGIPNEDSGWKQVHGDVFRAPYLLPVVAAILGTGWQLIVLNSLFLDLCTGKFMRIVGRCNMQC